VKESPWRRPRSLAEVAESSAAYSDFGYHLKDFLHTAAEAARGGQSLEPFVAAEPPRLADRFAEGKVCDAFLAGLADFLGRKNGFNTPAWSMAEDRILAEPWFSEEFPQVRLRLLRDTPSAFKDRNIFIFESALQVA
jgi:hypothetical protein